VARKQSAKNVIDSDRQASKTESPLSFKNILAGLIVTVLGGVILAYIIQDARFSAREINNLAPTSTIPPVGTQSIILTVLPDPRPIVNNSTMIFNIDEGNTLSIYDGKLFISVRNVYYTAATAVIGAPGCANQQITVGTVGSAVTYECGDKYDIRIGSIKRSSNSVEFYVTKLGE
jgi:hypothetical protein